jgi:hypothetical protein
MANYSTRVHYDGSIFWLIFWLLVFFPIAFVLLLTSGKFESNGRIYKLRYDGSRFWLCFWMLVFFPIAFVLIFVNGFEVTVQDII